MTFWVVAVALLVAVVALLAVPLSKRRSSLEDAAVEQDRSNVDLFRDQLTELERDRAQGLLSEEQFEQARVELTRRLLADVPPLAEAPDSGSTRSGGGTWRYAILACVPVVTVLAYLALGVPQAIDRDRLIAATGTPADRAATLDELSQRLAERLEKNPNDAEAWVLLARSNQMLGRAPEAVKAFARAIELMPGSAQLHADYADVQVAANDGQWTAPARASVAKALEIDAAHPKALWLAGSDAFVREDYPGALAIWEKLLPMVEPGSEVAQMVQSSIAEARALSGRPSAAADAAKDETASPPVGQPAPDKRAAVEAVTGTVTLGATLAADVKPADTVFIFARAAKGPKMPLAIHRITVQELPYSFRLDDAAAMTPGMSISRFDRVIVGARVSRSGDAAPRAGDLEGYSAPVKPGTSGIQVRIDARVQ